jgi:predicted ABC-type ATPase
MERPELFVVGGPNGAGKSTIASVILPEGFRVDRFVNADLIAQSLAPFSPESKAFTAGRMMLQRIRDFYAQRARFGFETTLASRTFAPFLQDARESGYLVHLTYLWLSSVELALDRVRVRVLRGGHDVPEEIVRRRYSRSLVNLFDLYLPLANTWLVCDNSRSELMEVARGGLQIAPMILQPATYAAIERDLADARTRG